MRAFTKYVGAAAFGLLATSAIAADHTDGGPNTLDMAPEADINDLYAWVKEDNQTLVMILSIGGVDSADFSPNVQYAFHIGRAGSDADAITTPASSWTDVICEFDESGMASCWAGDDDYVSGDASGDAGITSDSGMFKVHAGQHADPFFFYFTGFQKAVTFVTQNAGGLTTNDAGCPTDIGTVGSAGCSGANAGESVAGLLRGLLDGTYADDTCAPGNNLPQNSFAGLNVSALVVEMDLSLVEGSGDYLQVWASTHDKS